MRFRPGDVVKLKPELRFLRLPGCWLRVKHVGRIVGEGASFYAVEFPHLNRTLRLGRSICESFFVFADEQSWGTSRDSLTEAR